ncbi:MAG: membrane protein of unknown function [Promethearchaeota archaeon]|nr:MAG: membrane protein of unknown function [Candidatus Lokiarchaeota archaeon]
MKKSKRSIIFFALISILLGFNIFFTVVAFQLFPTYGGYSRQILFIKPNEDTGQAGYFIMVDELSPQARNYDIDWLLHSRGDLKVADDRKSVSFKVQSYVSNDNITLNATFLEPIDAISSEEGIFCPKNYDEGNNYPDIDTTYIKARYSGANHPLMSTILYPKNDSNTAQQIPEITSLPDGLKKIGDNDFLYYRDERASVQFSSPNIEFDGELFFIRRNNTNTSKIEYCFLQEAKYLKFENNISFQSSEPLTNILITYFNSSQISGYINGQNSQVQIFCPFIPEMIKINGDNTTISYANNLTTLSISDSCSFVISNSDKYYNPEKNQLTEPIPTPSMPTKDKWGINMNLFAGLTHPYILYNNSELEDLRNKIADSNKPWNNWTDTYIGDIDIELARDPEFYEDDQRRHAVYKLALDFTLNNNASVLNKLKEYLLDMGSITHYSADLRRAKSVEAYAIAFDMIYQNLTSNERSTIYNLLYEHAEPLKRMDLYHRNNHRVVDAGALGLAGLVLQDEEMINIATETCLDYFYNQNPADGGSFEGYSYMAFAFFHMSQFTTGLKRLGAFNFYEDDQILASYDYMAETLGPLGMPGSFEDCTFDRDIQEVLLFAAAQVNNTSPKRAARYQYIWEERQNNSQYISTNDYGYLLGANPSFHRILLYNVNETIQSEPFESRKEVWKASSMAYLRSGDTDGLFMPFSCKNYDQNHPHQDENSFELWAYGAYIANNPGYPGWGEKFHTWSQSTEGANALLIGGSDQLQVEANGLSTSISAPYFSIVRGDGTELYNDLGSFAYSPEPFILLFANMTILALCGVLYVLISRDISITSESIEKIKQKFKPSNFKDEVSSSQIPQQPSRKELVKLSYTHPFQVQEVLFEERYFEKNWKFLNRTIHLFLGGLLISFFLISCVDVTNTIIYHSQYHEDKYNLVFDILPYVIMGIYIIGSLLMGLLIYGFSKIYGRTNRLTVNKIAKTQSISIDNEKLSSLSTLSFLWIFPIIIFTGVLMLFTTVQDLKVAIHGLWTELNSINDVYDIMVSVLIGVIYNFGWIMLFGIPFIFLASWIFARGIKQLSERKISSKRIWKSPLIGYLLMFVVLFLLYMMLYIAFKSVFSLISIEAIVN